MKSFATLLSCFLFFSCIHEPKELDSVYSTKYPLPPDAEVLDTKDANILMSTEDGMLIEIDNTYIFIRHQNTGLAPSTEEMELDPIQ